jgi:hypothetical protein
MINCRLNIGKSSAVILISLTNQTWRLRIIVTIVEPLCESSFDVRPLTVDDAEERNIPRALL